MAILTIMDGIPLYTTAKEAIKWAESFGLSGHHIHFWQGYKGYMGGFDHSQATGMTVNPNTTQTVQPRQTTIVRQTTTTQATPTPTSTPTPTPGGGGGGY